MAHIWTVCRWAAVFSGVIALFLIIDFQGSTLKAPPASKISQTETATTGKTDALFHLLLALTAVIVAGYLLGKLFLFIGQPPVIGEVVGGIALGPSLLGRFSPDAVDYLFPAPVMPLLGIVAQIGVILYMFLLGLELDTEKLRKRARSVFVISQSSIAAPFLLGTALALYLYPRMSHAGVPFRNFALFLGVAMAITAFPVLARILTDQRIQRTRVGVHALACAAVNDVAAWCLLAIVVGIAQAKVGGTWLVVFWTAVFIAGMILIVKPFARRIVARNDDSAASRAVVTLVFVALLTSALTAELIGIHALFGAFLLGAIIPHDSSLAHGFTKKMEDLVTVVFLPAFFAFTGVRTQIGIVDGVEEWLICGLIILVAVVGKFGGTLAASRLTGQGWRESVSLAVLMNTRGLMELIVLNIGLELHVISPKLFAMMVIMALVTTMLTTPVLQMLMRNRQTTDDCFAPIESADVHEAK